MSEQIKPKSRKPRNTAGKKRASNESKVLQRFQLFAKEIRAKHAGQLKASKEMRETLIDLMKNFTPTDDADIQQFNSWIKYNNKKLKHQKEFTPLVYLEVDTDTLQTIQNPPSTPSLEQDEKELKGYLPDISNTELPVPDMSMNNNNATGQVEFGSDEETIGFN